jgi:hypothetical protein
VGCGTTPCGDKMISPPSTTLHSRRVDESEQILPKQKKIKIKIKWTIIKIL